MVPAATPELDLSDCSSLVTLYLSLSLLEPRSLITPPYVIIGHRRNLVEFYPPSPSPL